MVCLSGPLMFILSSYTLVWSPKAGYPCVVLGVLSVRPLSTIWPFFLFWHPTWSICIFTAIPQTLVLVWIPFGVCPAVVGSDTWPQESWTERCRQPWAGKECPWGDECCELHTCFSRQVKYWLVLCWAHGGYRHCSWTLVIPHPALFFTDKWMIFVQPGVLIFFLGINHLW